MTGLIIALIISVLMVILGFSSGGITLAAIGIVFSVILGIVTLIYGINAHVEKKDQEKADQEKQCVQDDLELKARQAKAAADAYQFTPEQKKRQELVDSIAAGQAPDVCPEDIRVVLQTRYGNATAIGVFDDEIIPSSYVRETYQMLPAPIDKFNEMLQIRTSTKTVSSQVHHELSSVTVQSKPQSVVGGAVKGAIIAGGVGAVVGAVATANKNNHPTTETHYFGGGTSTITNTYDYPCLKGYRVNPETNNVEQYELIIGRLWVRGSILERGLIQFWKEPFDKRGLFIGLFDFRRDNTSNRRDRMLKMEYCNKVPRVASEKQEYLQNERYDILKDLYRYGLFEDLDESVRDSSKVVYKGKSGIIVFDTEKSRYSQLYLLVNVVFNNNEKENIVKIDTRFLGSSESVKKSIKKLVDSGDLVIEEY